MYIEEQHANYKRKFFSFVRSFYTTSIILWARVFANNAGALVPMCLGVLENGHTVALRECSRALGWTVFVHVLRKYSDILIQSIFNVAVFNIHALNISAFSCRKTTAILNQ